MPTSATVTRLTSAEPPGAGAAEAPADDDSDDGAAAEPDGGSTAALADGSGAADGFEVTPNAAAVESVDGSGAGDGSAATFADNGSANFGRRIGVVIWALATALASANAQNHPCQPSRIFNLC
ncbi:MAG TPA: hypothetical protein PKY10_03570 [Lentisphaeria bacterium]|nr:hypothetical protein [Lentisphaeria bacterium]